MFKYEVLKTKRLKSVKILPFLFKVDWERLVKTHDGSEVRGVSVTKKITAADQLGLTAQLLNFLENVLFLEKAVITKIICGFFN